MRILLRKYADVRQGCFFLGSDQLHAQEKHERTANQEQMMNKRANELLDHEGKSTTNAFQRIAVVKSFARVQMH